MLYDSTLHGDVSKSTTIALPQQAADETKQFFLVATDQKWRQKNKGSSWTEVLTESFSRSAARSDMAKTARKNASSNSLKLF